MAAIYVTRQLPVGSLDQLEECHQVTVNLEDRALSQQELLAVVKKYDAVICLLSDRIDREVVETARGQVRIFANYAVGYDNIDVQAARDCGIIVTNTPGVLTEATADLAWALLLAAARHVVSADNYTRQGGFKGWHPTHYLGADFHGATLGIVGAGRIGQATARRALGFGMKVLYYNRTPKPDFEAETGARQVGLDELLGQSDFVSIHLPLSSETQYLLSEKKLHMLKPSAVLVNTARGPVLDEGALARMLRAKRIFAAGLDVYEHEPKIHPDLLHLDNVVLLPHLGSASWQTRVNMAKIAAANIAAVLADKEPLNPV